MQTASVNINDLASQLNLSKGTVSRILNDPAAPFAAKTRERVFSMAAELGYRPNPIARALATGRTGNVSLWIRNLRTPYRAYVAQAFESQIEANDRRLVIRLYGRDADSSSSEPSLQIMPESADGIITHGMPPKSWHHLIRGGSHAFPVVSTGAIIFPETLDHVGVDLQGAARKAVEHLIRPERTRIAYLCPVGASDERASSYFSVMAAAGLKPETVPYTDEARAVVRQTVRAYIEQHGHPEALFCHNDGAAIAAYRALVDLGLRVPDDVALVGCDGIEDTEYMPTTITTIVQPLDEMARLAWQFLKDRMENPGAPPRHVMLPATLVCRASS